MARQKKQKVKKKKGQENQQKGGHRSCVHFFTPEKEARRLLKRAKRILLSNGATSPEIKKLAEDHEEILADLAQGDGKIAELAKKALKLK